MNLFYESLPTSVIVNGKPVRIRTDFREYISLLDMLKDKDVKSVDKLLILSEYFLDDVEISQPAIDALCDFMSADFSDGEVSQTGTGRRKNLFSFSIDYPYILSAFLRDYGIDLIDIKYLHWWKFRMLFDGLSEDNEIKKRIMYRGMNLNEIKDPEERKRIRKIQKVIELKQEELTDFDIGDAFA
uniref:bacteriophage Gp15 family protein n=1 Tax=Mediterraneibacter gnavus TaxID=33038 RepID=UPI0040274B81